MTLTGSNARNWIILIAPGVRSLSRAALCMSSSDHYASLHVRAMYGLATIVIRQCGVHRRQDGPFSLVDELLSAPVFANVFTCLAR